MIKYLRGFGHQLELRFHQKLVIYKILKLIKKGEQEFLIGNKARSGKSYIVGGLILSYPYPINALILTPAPTETLTQFVDDLFKLYDDFASYKIFNPRSSKELKQIHIEGKHNIIILSKQLLQRFTNEKKIKQLSDIDFIFADESHFGMVTDISKDIFDTYCKSSTIKVFLTATFFKPRDVLSIRNVFFWTIDDERLCKNRDIKRLIERHGNDVKLFIKSDDDLKVYDSYPDLVILSLLFYPKFIDKIKYLLHSNDISLIFELHSNTKFMYENAVLLLLNFISNVIFKRIQNTSIKYNSRTLLTNESFSTQLWFLPVVNVNYTSQILKRMCLQHSVLKDFKYLILNSFVSAKDVKQVISEMEVDAKSRGKRGLIIFLGNMLTLGISLKNCDVVFLLNNTKSVDKITQCMFRAMTEAPGKKFGFIIDLDIYRILDSLSMYVSDITIGIEEIVNYFIKNKIINIDIDIATQSQVIKQLLAFYNAREYIGLVDLKNFQGHE